MVKTVKALLIGSALLALAACEERFKDPKLEGQYRSGDPVKVSEVFGCPIYIKRVQTENGYRDLYITYCGAVKQINWRVPNGKTSYDLTWINGNDAMVPQ